MAEQSKASEFLKDNFGGMLGLAPGSDLMMGQIDRFMSQLSGLTGGQLDRIFGIDGEEEDPLTPGKKKQPLQPLTPEQPVGAGSNTESALLSQFLGGRL